MISHRIVRAPNPALALGQLGGHIKRGFKHPIGPRTKKPMALVSALPLHLASDKMVLSFMDRSDPTASYDNQPHKGDNAVVIVPKAEIHLSVISGVCPGDWKGVKIAFGEAIDEPEELDIDPTGLNIADSDRLMDQVEELGCDCSKLGGYPLWTKKIVDVDLLMGRRESFHHRLTADVVDFKLGDGGVVFVFVDAEGEAGALLWQQVR
jgi:hypothetical protein